MYIMPIIDCNVHLNYYSNIHKRKKTPSLKERLTELLHTMSNNNIDYSLILTSYKFDSERPSTSQIIDILKNKDYKLGVVAGFTIDNHNDYTLNNI